MKPPFSLLVVHGDGSRVLRFSLPRGIVYGMLGLAATAVGLAGGYVRRERGQVVVLSQSVDDQRELIDSFQTRVAAVRGEIMAWRGLHARMWDALGPAGGPDRNPSGVGGGTPDADVPDADATPRPEEELELLSSSVAEEGPRLRELERVISHTGDLMAALPLRWPVHGKVNSEYGLRRSPWNGAREHHEGIDIGSSPNTPVRAPAPGTVLEATSAGTYGNEVLIDHGNGVTSRYGHLAKLQVKLGERVEKGQVIGLVGSTGRSTGPHLHYEVAVEGKPVDPRGFLWER